MYDSEATTRGIKVAVKASFVAERSQPLEGRWFFAYRIRIHNRGEVPVQLINRHWVITDAHGNVEEVRGPGVVGNNRCWHLESPSNTPHSAPWRRRSGPWRAVTRWSPRTAEHFWAKIGQFTLSEPLAVN